MRATFLFLPTVCLGMLCACGRPASIPPGAASKAVRAGVAANVNATISTSQGRSTERAAAQTSSDDGNEARSPAVHPHPLWAAPLSSEDVQTYLSVMHAAADRVQHPITADFAAQQRNAAQNARLASVAAQVQKAAAASEATRKAIMDATRQGDFTTARALTAQMPPPASMPTFPQESAAEHAADTDWTSISDGSADEVIAEQRHVDSDRWSDIQRAVEDAVPSQDTVYADGDGLTPTAQERKLQTAAEALIAQSRKALASRVAQIHSVELVARAKTCIEPARTESMRNVLMPRRKALHDGDRFAPTVAVMSPARAIQRGGES